MFQYPPQDNSYVTWIIARIPQEKIVDGQVSVGDIEGSAGLSFGGWQGAMATARDEAKRADEPRYVLPVIVGHRNGGAYIAQYVLGQGYMALGVDGRMSGVPMPRFVY
jgi:hypothetical protein